MKTKRHLDLTNEEVYEQAENCVSIEIKACLKEKITEI